MNIIELNNEQFDKEVINYEGRVLVDFYADWCGPCRMLRPTIETIANENDTVKVAAVNVDEANDLASQYNVMSIPCVVLFENGKEINRSVGLKPKEELEKMIGE